MTSGKVTYRNRASPRGDAAVEISGNVLRGFIQHFRAAGSAKEIDRDALSEKIKEMVTTHRAWCDPARKVSLQDVRPTLKGLIRSKTAAEFVSKLHKSDVATSSLFQKTYLDPFDQGPHDLDWERAPDIRTLGLDDLREIARQALHVCTSGDEKRGRRKDFNSLGLIRMCAKLWNEYTGCDASPGSKDTPNAFMRYLKFFVDSFQLDVDLSWNLVRDAIGGPKVRRNTVRRAIENKGKIVRLLDRKSGARQKNRVF